MRPDAPVVVAQGVVTAARRGQRPHPEAAEQLRGQQPLHQEGEAGLGHEARKQQVAGVRGDRVRPLAPVEEGQRVVALALQPERLVEARPERLRLPGEPLGFMGLPQPAQQEGARAQGGVRVALHLDQRHGSVQDHPPVLGADGVVGVLPALVDQPLVPLLLVGQEPLARLKPSEEPVERPLERGAQPLGKGPVARLLGVKPEEPDEERGRVDAPVVEPVGDVAQERPLPDPQLVGDLPRLGLPLGVALVGLSLKPREEPQDTPGQLRQLGEDLQRRDQAVPPEDRPEPGEPRRRGQPPLEAQHQPFKIPSGPAHQPREHPPVLSPWRRGGEAEPPGELRGWALPLEQPHDPRPPAPERGPTFWANVHPNAQPALYRRRHGAREPDT